MEKLKALARVEKLRKIELEIALGFHWMPQIDYGELKFPITAWQILAAQGLMTHEEADRLTKEWLDGGGMNQFIKREYDEQNTD